MSLNESIDEIISPDLRDLSRSNLNRLIRVVKAIQKMNFDTTFFSTSTAKGFLEVRVRSSALPTAEDRCEWQQSVVGEGFVVMTAPIAQAGDVLWDSSGGGSWDTYADVTLPFEDAEATPAREITDGDQRWLYIHILLESGETPVVMLGDDGYYPLDDPLNKIIRWRLSKWSFTVAGEGEDRVVTATRLWNAWKSGAITIPAVVGGP